jgi:hypothetical protein
MVPNFKFWKTAYSIFTTVGKVIWEVIQNFINCEQQTNYHVAFLKAFRNYIRSETFLHSTFQIKYFKNTEKQNKIVRSIFDYSHLAIKSINSQNSTIIQKIQKKCLLAVVNSPYINSKSILNSRYPNNSNKGKNTHRYLFKKSRNRKYPHYVYYKWIQDK